MPPQPQPPAGYPHQPGPYHGQQPPPGGPYFVPTPGPVFVPTGDHRKRRRNALIGLTIAVVLFGGMATWGALDDSPSIFVEDAKPRDCLNKEGSGEDVSMSIVDCDSIDADYRVMSKPSPDGNCPEVYDTYYRKRNGVTTFRLCVDEINGSTDSL